MASASSLTQDEIRKLAEERAIRRREDLPPNMYKYWRAKESLFSRFSEGIMLDEESWFSATHEAIAYRLAVQCRNNVVMDACSGAGGNTIQFAMTCKHVIALDIDPVKLEMARNNARIYGVEDRITFLCGDIRDFARDYGADVPSETSHLWQGWDKRHIDIVFSSPPWGGVDYQTPSLIGAKKQEGIDENLYPLSALRPDGGKALFDMFRKIANRVLLYLPRNVNLNDVAELASADGPGSYSVHIEEMWLGTRLKALGVFLKRQKVA